MKTQLCLVSDQAAANLLPALDPALKPEKVVLVVSSKMRTRAERLSRVLQQHGIAVKSVDLTNEHDLSATEEDLLRLAEAMPEEDIALNITGGTKLMSAAAQSVASVSDWKMFYVDVDTDQISWLSPKGRADHALTEQLRLRVYLQSYGFDLVEKPRRPQASPEQQKLTETLLMQIGSLEAPLSTLNWLAQQAENSRRLSIALDAKQQDSRSLDALLRNFESAGAITVEGNEVKFASKADLGFVKGGWLELHVMQIIHQLSGELGIRDKAANLEVIDSAGVKNELDLACIVRNRLFVIECKTARMDRPEAPKANDTLFKLVENCRRVGGLGTRGMLVSYRDLGESEKKLAVALGIETVCAAEINRLPEVLKVWFRPR
jgi:hypothetical protein